MYAEAGQPTAAIVSNENAIVDTTCYWIACKDLQEAHYLLAIINSDTLYAAVQPLMPKGQFGARHVHKHLWKLPIPEFDRDNLRHATLAKAGERAAAGAAQRLAELRAERGERLTVTIARRELRKWLRDSVEGATVELAVARLIPPRKLTLEEWQERRKDRPTLHLNFDAAEAIREERELRDGQWERYLEDVWEKNTS